MSTQVERKEIIESLVASGMTPEQAAAAYESAFAPKTSGGTPLPFELLKVNNDATVADMGALVADPIKDEEADEVVGYNKVYKFEDIDFLILDRRATWSKYDGATGRTTVKSQLLDTFAKADAYIDSISGVPVAKLKETDDEIKYQQLILVGVRPRGSAEPFEFYNMYLKGAMLYNVNQLLDTCTGSKTSKKGSVKYTEFDLSNSVAVSLPSTQVLTNVMPFLDAKTAFNDYVTKFNEALGSPKATEGEAGLPE